LKGIHSSLMTAGALAALALALAAGAVRAAEEEPNEALIEMIAALVADADRDMRALGLQQVREEVPGEAATKKFAELLPGLPTDGQAGLLEALGDRQDPAALPAVLEALKSDHDAVRAAAITALGPLGGKDQASLLAEKTAAGSQAEKDAARQSLIRLRGEGVNEAVEAALAGASGEVRVALLGVLAARNARQSLPAVLAGATDADSAVRQAALRAVRYLADENDAGAVVGLLKGASDDTERRSALLALLTIASRGREACAEPVIAGLADADAATKAALLSVLARAGGQKALDGVAAGLEDGDETVRDQAVRVLSTWPTEAALPHLTKLAESETLRHKVLAIRGLIRLASPQEDKPADLQALAEVMKLADRADEKRQVLGVLGAVPTAESLALAASVLDDNELVEEAGLAVVLIAEKMPEDGRDAAKQALQKMLRYSADDSIRQRAEKLLGTP